MVTFSTPAHIAGMIQHTDLIERERVRFLARQEETVCVTLLVPTSNVDSQTAPRYLSNLVSDAQSRLKKAKLLTNDLREKLVRAKNFIKDSPFWSFQSESLAIFLSPSVFQYVRVPVKTHDLLVIGNRFYLVPLFKVLQGQGLFYLLTLSQDTSTLYAGTRHSLTQVDFEQLPSMADVMAYLDAEKQLQFHTASTPFAGMHGRRSAMFFGHGAGNDSAVQKDFISEYFRKLNGAVSRILHGQTAPLILAGAEFLLPLYQSENTYPYLMPDGIRGNFENPALDELRKRAWPIVEPVFKVELADALERLNETPHRELVESSIEQLLPAAQAGAIDSLFIRDDALSFGSYDSGANQIEIRGEDAPVADELFNIVAIHTFLNRGSIFLLEANSMPGTTAASALLRFPLPLEAQTQGDATRRP